MEFSALHELRFEKEGRDDANAYEHVLLVWPPGFDPLPLAKAVLVMVLSVVLAVVLGAVFGG